MEMSPIAAQPIIIGIVMQQMSLQHRVDLSQLLTYEVARRHFKSI
jgi:hypothetical protein